MTRAELETAMLQAHFRQKALGPSMTADPAKHVHAMAEVVWAEIEAIRERRTKEDAGEKLP